MLQYDDWVEVAPVTDVPPGTHKAFEVSHEVRGIVSLNVIVINLDGDFYAVDDVCSHDGGKLSAGWLDDKGELVCPRHGAHFCVKTGDALSPPAYEAINTYPARIREGTIEIKLA